MTPDQAKTIAGYFVSMMEREFKNTCRVLAAVPDDRRDYKPDEKSRTAWDLATHLALSDIWFLGSIVDGRFVYDPGAEERAAAQFASIRDLVGHYEREYGALLARLRALPPDRLAAPADFFGTTDNAVVEYLGLANNHGIHHRGQLASYLRAMGSKVPALYGGSADEPMNAAAG